MTLPLLILRPQPGADATAARARALGFEAVVRPLFAIEPCDWALPDEPFEAVMLTSANAAQEQLRSLAHLPLYAVGVATAEAARKLGFRDIRTGSGDVGLLAHRILADCVRTVLHPVGRDVTAFDPGPPRMIRRTAYAAVAIEPPPALPGEAVALLHSARAARRFAQIVSDRAVFAIAAISPAVLTAAGPGWRAAIAAEVPDDDALLAAAARLCH